MKSLTTPDFWRSYSQLPLSVKQQAKKIYRFWKVNNVHPSLHFKKVKDDVWSIRINQDYRALALKQDGDYYWFWIGSHKDYEKLIQ